MKDLERQWIIDLLTTENCSCVIGNGATVRSFYGRGVSDLYRLLTEEPEFLRGAFVADKVVGRGAAALMILGGVKGVFARVISTPALEFFRTYGVDAAFATEVPHIINRQGTDWCPLEKRCIHAKTVEECREIIDRFVRELPRSAVKEKGSNA